jgi:hypothetical protein
MVDGGYSISRKKVEVILIVTETMTGNKVFEPPVTV